MVTAGITGSDLLGVPASLPVDINSRQPSNTSYLHPTAFRFYLGRIPSVTYFCQAANIPSMDVAELEFTNMFANIKECSGKPAYGALTIRFLIDEDMENWRAIHDWMRDISLFENNTEILKPESDHKSDARLVVLTNGMNPNVEVTFKDCWPTSIGEVSFDSAVTDLENLNVDVTFAFDSFDVVKL